MNAVANKTFRKNRQLGHDLDTKKYWLPTTNTNFLLVGGTKDVELLEKGEAIMEDVELLEERHATMEDFELLEERYCMQCNNLDKTVGLMRSRSLD